MNEALANTTLASPAGSPPAAIDASNQFTRANVIGMFLTLQLCQLTQPYGSLLFRGISGFFWRCNPISSFVEACIIFWHLGAIVFRHWRESRPSVLKKLQEVAAGLLLLRGAMGKNDDGILMQKLMTGSFLDKAETVGPTSEENSGVVSTGQEPTDVSQSDAHPTTVSRQPTLEANRPPTRNNTLPAYDLASEKSKILREAFGSNALAHKELRIDIFTAFAELTVFLKLITVRGDGWYTGAGVFLVTGWVAVQLLLVLLHRREMNEIEMVATVRAARTLNGELKEHGPRWYSLFIVLHLPFFAYPAYLATFKPWFSENATGFASWLRDYGERVYPLFATGIIWLAFGSLIIGIQHILTARETPAPWKFIFPFAIPWLVVWFLASWSSYIVQYSGDSSRSPDSALFFKPHSPLYYIVDRSFEKFFLLLFNGFLMLGLLSVELAIYFNTFFPAYDPSEASLPENKPTRKISSSWGNALFVLVIFGLYLHWYDPSKTWKPNWTDFLG
jgi:hypothetical protein